MPHRSHPFPCLVVRRRGVRRMTLRVSDAGVRLTVPPQVRSAQIDAFLRARRDWVRDRLAEIGPAGAGLADGDRLALLDGELLLDVTRRPGRARARRDGAVLGVALADDADLDAVVERWYRAAAARELGVRADAAARRLGADVAGVTVRDTRSRWGSCSSAGRLSFSWRLLLAPEAVLDYVVVHEACHLVRPDHSPAFWALVREQMPGYEVPRRWLRDEGARLRLGPAWRGRG
ncbi:MAG: M48 family metallopeptidase [Thermoleophilia bacterium]